MGATTSRAAAKASTRLPAPSHGGQLARKHPAQRPVNPAYRRPVVNPLVNNHPQKPPGWQMSAAPHPSNQPQPLPQGQIARPIFEAVSVSNPYGLSANMLAGPGNHPLDYLASHGNLRNSNFDSPPHNRHAILSSSYHQHNQDNQHNVTYGPGIPYFPE